MKAGRVFHILFATALLLTTPAVAAQERDSGFEVGIRTGYAFAAGHLGAPPSGTDANYDVDLGDRVSGQWPFWIDAGYRFNYSFYLGFYFQYGIGFVNDDVLTTCRDANVDCSASDVRFGLMGRYHLPMVWQFSPWVGYGLGGEWLSYSGHRTDVSASADWSWSGLEFMNLQLGGDVRLPHRVVVAPFISFSLGHYDDRTETRSGTLPILGAVTGTYTGVAKTSIHEWILIGLRVAVMP